MDNLSTYVATIIVTVIAGYILQTLTPRSSVVFWPAHHFRFSVPVTQPTPTTVTITTHAITVQNVGNRRAEFIQVVHASKPDIYHMWPSLVHKAEMRSSGATSVHVIEVPELGPKEWFTLEFLSIGTQPPQLQYIRSKDGHAQQVSVALQWAVPKWLAQLRWFIYYAGLVFLAYWVAKAANLLWGALMTK